MGKFEKEFNESDGWMGRLSISVFNNTEIKKVSDFYNILELLKTMNWFPCGVAIKDIEKMYTEKFPSLKYLKLKNANAFKQYIFQKGEKLEKGGWIKKVAIKSDLRKKKIIWTEKAHTLYKKVKKEMEA